MPRRFLVVGATFALAMLLYIDRASISVAKSGMARDLQLTDTRWGWVMSAFALGYALFQTPSGILADRFGPRKVLAGVVVFWSIFTAMTGAVWTFGSLLAVRFLFGAGEAGAFPGSARAFYAWLPVGERGLAQGVIFSGSRLGAALAMPGVAWMIDRVGWRQSFAILGAVGLFWAWAWHAWFRDDPRDHAGLPAEELETILSQRQSSAEGELAAPSLPVRSLFGSLTLWMLMGQYFASNFTFFFGLTWMPSYLKSTYGLDDVQAGFYAMWPLLAGVAGNWVSGGMVDLLYRRGKFKLSRRLPAVVGFLMAALGVAGLPMMPSVGGAVACLALAIFGADMTLSPSWSACIDIGRRHAGAVSGTMNMAGNLGSFVTSLAFPYLAFWTGSVLPFFAAGAVLNLLGAAAWFQVKTDVPLEAP